jgi:3-dehydroquinate synthase
MSDAPVSQRLSIRSGQGDYSVFGAATLDAMAGVIEAIDDRVVVVDKNVSTLYADALRRLLRSSPTVVFDAVETAKTLRGVEKILACLTQHNKTRRTTIVAIGGGIVQDVATLAAHLYHRGLSFVYVPTTLLSMADSCIGAKCGINFAGFKNVVGVFHSPRQVVICTPFLDSLSDADLISGYGEILKLSLTGSAAFYRNVIDCLDRNGPRNSSVEALVFDSLQVKKEVIEADEYEVEYRRVLNYGHTFGHALESITDYSVPHGLGVAWGIGAANEIAVRRGILAPSDHAAIRAVIGRHFPVRLTRRVSASELVAAARKDKKAAAGLVQMALLEAPGKLRLERIAFVEHLEEAISAFLVSADAVPGT